MVDGFLNTKFINLISQNKAVSRENKRNFEEVKDGTNYLISAVERVESKVVPKGQAFSEEMCTQA
jgi:hypothetical protein